MGLEKQGLVESFLEARPMHERRQVTGKKAGGQEFIGERTAGGGCGIQGELRGEKRDK